MKPGLALIFTLAVAPAEAALTEGAKLAAVYDTILQARFDRVDAQLAGTCPPAPAGACKSLAAVSLWWQILLDPNSRRLDNQFTDRAADAIAANEAWTQQEPQRAEAWFYLAGSYAPLVQWRVLRGERLAAAREGKKIKDALERALRLDPTLSDAYFGIGLYHYYADVAPAALKVVRWLLLLPGGDRVAGLQEMLKAREQGELLTGEADFQIHLLYLWYEQRASDALALLERLDARYPFNPLFLERIAAVRDEYFHDHPASAAAWQELLDRARRGRVSQAQSTEVGARLGLARELDAMFETDRAIAELKAAVKDHPAAPYSAHAQGELQLGAAYDRLDQRELAVAAYNAAIALAPRDDPRRVRAQARAALRQAPDPRLGEAYRVSLEGWRASDIVEGEALLARASALAPADPVIRYRHARVLEACGRSDQARRELEKVIAARDVPAVVLASAYVEYAMHVERAGDRTRALALYRDATRIVGGDPRAREQATRAIRRLASFSPHFSLTSSFSHP